MAVAPTDLRQLAATTVAASGLDMAAAAGKFLEDFSNSHAAEIDKVAAKLTLVVPALAGIPWEFRLRLTLRARHPLNRHLT